MAQNVKKQVYGWYPYRYLITYKKTRTNIITPSDEQRAPYINTEGTRQIHPPVYVFPY